MVRVWHELEGRVHLLCLGPLTNVAAALRRDPDVLGRFTSVTIMGGMGLQANSASVLAVYPQFLVKGDTNTNHDADAAAVVAASAGEVTWVGMNVTARLRVLLAEIDASTQVGEFARSITAEYSRHCTTMYDAHELIFTAHDVVAASVLLDQQVSLESTYAQPVVETADDGRSSLWGGSVGDGPAHRFVQDIDYPPVLERLDRATASA